MKIAFVLGTAGGGTGRHVRMLAEGCSAEGLEVCVSGPARTDRDFGFAEVATFVPVEIADRPRPVRDVLAIVRLRRLLRSAGADVVHAHGLRAGAFAALARTGSRRRPPLVVTVHNAPAAAGPGNISPVYRVLELIVARRSDSVLCVSADLEQRMRAAGARRVGRAIVPPPAIAPDVSAETRNPAGGSGGSSPRAGRAAETRKTSGAGGSGGCPPGRESGGSSPRAGCAAETSPAPGSYRPLVLAVGRLAAQKGFGVLLQAASRWRDLRPEPRLMIVGQGPLEAELKAQAVSLGVDAEFAGQRPDVPALLAAADVFVLPSLWEGQALILQEALRAGAPVVATRTGGNPDLAGDAAVLVPPGDPARLAAAVREVLADPALAHRLRQAALDRARTLPAEKDAISAALTEYRHLIGMLRDRHVAE